MAETHEYIDFGNNVTEVWDVCLKKGTIISIDRDAGTASVEIDGIGRENNVPIFYHCQGQQDTEGGHVAFNEEDAVLVLAENSRRGFSESYSVVGFQGGLKSCNAYFAEIQVWVGHCVVSLLWDINTDSLLDTSEHGFSNPVGILDTSTPEWTNLCPEYDTWVATLSLSGVDLYGADYVFSNSGYSTSFYGQALYLEWPYARDGGTSKATEDYDADMDFTVIGSKTVSAADKTTTDCGEFTDTSGTWDHSSTSNGTYRIWKYISRNQAAEALWFIKTSSFSAACERELLSCDPHLVKYSAVWSAEETVTWGWLPQQNQTKDGSFYLIYEYYVGGGEITERGGTSYESTAPGFNLKGALCPSAVLTVLEVFADTPVSADNYHIKWAIGEDRNKKISEMADSADMEAAVVSAIQLGQTLPGNTEADGYLYSTGGNFSVYKIQFFKKE